MRSYNSCPLDHTVGGREMYMKTKISILRGFIGTVKEVSVSGRDI